MGQKKKAKEEVFVVLVKAFLEGIEGATHNSESWIKANVLEIMMQWLEMEKIGLSLSREQKQKLADVLPNSRDSYREEDPEKDIIYLRGIVEDMLRKYCI